MFCRNCGKEVDVKAVVCVSCGVPPKVEKKYCGHCGVPTEANQTLCTKCGVALTTSGGGNGEKSKIVAGLLGILLGGVGVHKFYIGYTKQGIITAVIWVFGWILIGLPSLVMGVIGIIEGIIYLTKSDDEFQEIYLNNNKEWF